MVSVLQAMAWSFKQLKRPDILASVLIPCMIHSILLFGGIYMIYSWLSRYFMSFETPAFLDFTDGLAWLSVVFEMVFNVARWILVFGLCLGFVGFGLTVTTTIAHFLASPFNGWLSLKAESQLRTVHHPELALMQSFKRGLSREWQRFRYWLLRSVPLGVITAIFFWVPVIGSLISACWFVFGSWMVGLQAIDYVADNNGLSFQDTVSRCNTCRTSIAMLGAILMGMMMVPGLNLLSMAISVLAGTYLWVTLDSPQKAQRVAGD